MKNENNSNLYLADEGKIFRRKSDNFIMGTGIDLGINDSIDNYIEDNMTEDEKKEYEEKENSEKHQSLKIKNKIGK